MEGAGIVPRTSRSTWVQHTQAQTLDWMVNGWAGSSGNRRSVSQAWEPRREERESPAWISPSLWGSSSWGAKMPYFWSSLKTVGDSKQDSGIIWGQKQPRMGTFTSWLWKSGCQALPLPSPTSSTGTQDCVRLLLFRFCFSFDNAGKIEVGNKPILTLWKLENKVTVLAPWTMWNNWYLLSFK